MKLATSPGKINSITCKLSSNEIMKLNEICKKKNVGRSTVTRELIQEFIEQNKHLLSE